MRHSRHSCVDILRYVTYILVMTRKMLRFFREHGVSGPTRNMRKGDSRINMLELANEGLREINILLRLEVRDLKQRIRGLEEAGT